ncbi:hypothetical protein [Streptomyces bluensis]|uniref:hypothetical protein n=1 Tax=Streptomyces bluensis TaxID=33897 RepID=UPI001674F353|nr:hypothetical protein [Streptomyces bluensis]
MPEEEGRRVDYIMVRCDDYGPTLRVGLCGQVFSEPVEGVWASDHYGLVADLLLPGHQPGSWVSDCGTLPRRAEVTSRQVV